MGRRVLLFSSIGHALMHMMTAFYAVIVLTLAAVWDLPVERLLELYAPATVLLGVMSLPAGWASDRFGAPVMMVVMFVGMGLSSIACGLVATGDTLALIDRAVRHRRVRRDLPFGRHRLGHPHRQGAGPCHGRERPVGQRRAGALRHRAGRADHARLVARRLHRAGRRLRRDRRDRGLADPATARSATGRCPRRPASRPAAPSSGASSPCSRSPWRWRASIWQAVMFGSALVFETRLAARSRACATGWRRGAWHPGGAVGRPRDLDDLHRLGLRPVRAWAGASSTAIR